MKVKVYSTPTCLWCVKAKDFLKKNKIDFTEINVAADHDAAEEMIEKSGQISVPVIEIGDEIIVGFDEPRIKHLLKLK
jgi:glutaredoxin-like YruB-family protein